MDPAVMWRDVILDGDPVPPEPFPSRVEAFLMGCAMYSGLRERDVLDLSEGLAVAFGGESDG